MQWLRQLALGICLLCAAAGMIRIFWPDNHFKPVINTVLLLYILTTVLQTGAGADWNSVADVIERFEVPTISPTDLSDYQEELSREVSVQALEELFHQHALDADFVWEGEILHVILPKAEDLPEAQQLMEENAGTLPFAVEVEGGQ